MARQIRFIEPVDSISGDLGQKQKLLYAKRNNSAWDAPRNVRNSARNYKTTYVGLYRKFSGKKYFAVRKRSTFHSTPAAINNMALMGAANSIAAVVAKDLSHLTQLQQLWAQYRAQGGGYGFRSWLVMYIQPQVADKVSYLTISAGATVVALGGNPFSGTADSVRIPSAILVKFAEVIDPAWVPFYINGEKGVFRISGESLPTFSYYINNPTINTFGLTSSNVGPTAFVKYGELWLYSSDGQPIRAADNMSIAGNYVTSNIGPTPSN